METILNYDWTTLDANYVLKLSDSLKNENCTYKYLSMRRTYFHCTKSSIIEIFFKSLIANNSIYYISISLTNIYNDYLKLFFDSLKTNKILQNLRLNPYDFSCEPEYIKKILNDKNNGLCYNTYNTLGNCIGDSLFNLTQSLKVNNHLEIIDLSYCKIGDEGVKLLSESLEVNNYLKIIILCRNEIGDVGIDYLSNSLKKNNSLQNLILCGNFIGNEGARSLSNCLKKNKSLFELNLKENNDIDSIGISFIYDSLMVNSTIKYCIITENDVYDNTFIPHYGDR